MIVFVDTSVLVKLYVEERGSEQMRALTAPGEPMAASHLAFAEMHATFARRRREGLLHPDEFEELVVRWAEDWQGFTQVPIGAEVLALVPGLCENHPLRGADALHLASALLLQENGLDVTFACSDRLLLAAANSERLATYNPVQAPQ
ncbi:MAG: type II toxin-antitoxin system VapC family toxin [Acidobacteriota bacterium]